MLKISYLPEEMRKLIQFILLRPVTWMANKFSSSPDTKRVHEALSDLLIAIESNHGKHVLQIPFNANNDKWIIFSDQHKGAKNGADDFWGCEKNYLAALEFYNDQKYGLISLGDNEELWENTLIAVQKKNKATIKKEKHFIERNAFVKVFGNHDLFWSTDPLAQWQLKRMYKQEVKIYEGLVLSTDFRGKNFRILLTHGHQGDTQSDGNWFSKWFVTYIWGPLQSYLRINPNTPSCNDVLKTEHNAIMYDWSAQQNDLILVTGHTHQPVFLSLTHLERLYKRLADARNQHNKESEDEIIKEIATRKLEQSEDYYERFEKIKPSYFNSGCCCFNDGDITGIEIADNKIMLIKWTSKNSISQRIVLEEKNLEELASQLRSNPN